MIDFNIEEKRIIIAILIAIMEADGIIDSHEIDYLDNIIQNLSLNEFDLDSIDELDINLVTAHFKNFSEEKKKLAISFFLEMAKCDGYVDPREIDVINKLND